jgi:hypothetical protein
MASRFQASDAIAERVNHERQIADQPREFGLYLSTRDCQAFIPCKSLKATYQWLRSHGIPRRGNGSVDRRDIQRELDRMKRKPRRVMAAASLANLRRRKTA